MAIARQKAKLTSEARVRDIKAPASGEMTVWDEDMRSFGLRVRASGIKTFVAQFRVNGIQRKVTIGKWPKMTVDAARREAKRLFGLAGAHRDPVAERRREEAERKAATLTLRDVFDNYLASRGDKMRPATVATYRSLQRGPLADLMERPLVSLTLGAEVARNHDKVAKVHGPGTATVAHRVLGAAINYAMDDPKYIAPDGTSIIARNPVKALKRKWHRHAPRQSYIAMADLPAWWRSLDGLDPTARDYLRFVLLTGLRRREATGLTWDEVDLDQRVIKLAGTRTKNRQAHTLPLGTFLIEMLRRRKAEATTGLVFQPKYGRELATKYLTNQVERRCGIKSTVHDLRRTFISIAEGRDTGMYALKKLLNHTVSEVTAGYIQFDVERLRRAMQLIEAFVLSSVGETPPAATVVELRVTR
jgi:integrase